MNGRLASISLNATSSHGTGDAQDKAETTEMNNMRAAKKGMEMIIRRLITLSSVMPRLPSMSGYPPFPQVTVAWESMPIFGVCFFGANSNHQMNGILRFIYFTLMIALSTMNPRAFAPQKRVPLYSLAMSFGQWIDKTVVSWIPGFTRMFFVRPLFGAKVANVSVCKCRHQNFLARISGTTSRKWRGTTNP